jgi:GT2 family glycosyltransferase
MSEKFAAFIMTYERPQEVLIMIDNLFSQTFPPEKILVVDNSATLSTRDAVAQLNHQRVEYLRVGHNSGPAGAAHHGMKHLSALGYTWIYWGDDNDPPRTADAFERVLELRDADPEIGALGAFGTRFSNAGARMKKIPTGALKKVLEVHSISGGNTLIINARVIEKAGLPDPDLFFGFEEFDYCLRIRKSGYKLLVNGVLFKEYRIKSGKPQRRTEDVFKNKVLWREYYSVRNLLYIFTHKHFNLWVILVIVTRTVVKQLFSLRQGVAYFRIYAKLTCRAIIDGIRKNMGLTLQPGKSKF